MKRATLPTSSATTSRPPLGTTLSKLWHRFWSSGIANPLSAIEQITYLLFLRRLEEIDDEQALLARRKRRAFVSRFKGHEDCRWSTIKRLDQEPMLQVVRDRAFPFMKSLRTQGNTFPDAMRDAVFIIQKPGLLSEAVKLIDALPLGEDDNDAQGDLYEELLSELNLAGKNGQFRTPRHIVRAMVALCDPKPGEWICDPAAGTAGFLVAAYQWIRSNSPAKSRDGAHLHGERLVGYDFDITMVRLGLMNMMLHGIDDPEFRYQDTLSSSFTPPRSFDLILANPPFTGSIDTRDTREDLLRLGTSKTELLFLDLCRSLLADGGRCAIIVPEGVLFGSTGAHRTVRRALVEQNRVEAIISLPGGCFKPYTGVKAAILLFTKGGTTQQIWFYEVTGDGYTLDDRRELDPGHDDLRIVPQAYRIFVRGSKERWESTEAQATAERQSWTASRRAIEERDYDLAATLYRPEGLDVERHEEPRVILARVRHLEAELAGCLTRIEAALERRGHA